MKFDRQIAAMCGNVHAGHDNRMILATANVQSRNDGKT